MAERVNITTAAKLTGRAEKTIRAWLAEDPCPLSVEWGNYRGGRRAGKSVTKGRTRLLDVDELQALHKKRGGVDWHALYLPVPCVRDLLERLEAVEAMLEALRQRAPHLFMPVERAWIPVGQLDAIVAPLAIEAPQMPASASAAQQTSGGGDTLPDGLVPVDRFALDHGMRASQRTTWLEPVREGKLPAHINLEGWRHAGAHGKVARVFYALDAAERRSFCARWRNTAWIRPCEDPACECHELLGASAVLVGSEVREHE